MSSLDIELLDWQKDALQHDARFKVIAAGRRCGKSHLAAVSMILNALNGKPGKTFYVAPTQGIARDVMWHSLFDIAGDLIEWSNVNNLEMDIAGNRIYLKGSDRPDSLRGVSLKHLVLDEAAFIKEDVFNNILRPALSDRMGSCIFIGTPEGRNWFYDLYEGAGEWEDYERWHLTTYDNPFVRRSEIEAAKKTLPRWSFNQEYMASFDAQGSEYFNEADFEIVEKGPRSDGDYYVAVDLAGFASAGAKKNKRRDSTAISTVFVDDDGHWWVNEIDKGQWGLNETCARIFRAVEKYRPVSVGIEKGLAQQAVMQPLADQMRRENRIFNIELLSHGNQKKEDRILWALQGKSQHGMIHLKKGDWNADFIDEAIMFPSRLAHDDMIDSLAYIDQLYQKSYHKDIVTDDWEPEDMAMGY
jgi:predicted phage terminase large subunit-like protein